MQNRPVLITYLALWLVFPDMKCVFFSCASSLFNTDASLQENRALPKIIDKIINISKSNLFFNTLRFIYIYIHLTELAT